MFRHYSSNASGDILKADKHGRIFIVAQEMVCVSHGVSRQIRKLTQTNRNPFPGGLKILWKYIWRHMVETLKCKLELRLKTSRVWPRIYKGRLMNIMNVCNNLSIYLLRFNAFGMRPNNFRLNETTRTFKIGWFQSFFFKKSRMSYLSIFGTLDLISKNVPSD